MLSDFENVAASFPQLYPLIINSEKIRRAVLSKQLSVFYTQPGLSLAKRNLDLQYFKLSA